MPSKQRILAGTALFASGIALFTACSGGGSNQANQQADPPTASESTASSDPASDFDPMPVANEVCKQARQDGARTAGAALIVAIEGSPDKWNDSRLREARDAIRDTCPQHYDGIQAGIVEAGKTLQGK